MNYFEFYDLPLSFNPDQGVVKQTFYALSKKYHPDFYINEDQAKQDEVLELSTLNNKAFQVLKDPQKRLHYILKLKNQLNEEDNYALPQSFLMDMMDVNEALMELEMEPNPSQLASIKSQVDDLEQNLAKELADLTSAFDTAIVAEQEKLLVAIKDIYFRNKYLWRIKESLSRLSA
jgi:molecular chaperone HscB